MQDGKTSREPGKQESQGGLESRGEGGRIRHREKGNCSSHSGGCGLACRGRGLGRGEWGATAYPAREREETSQLGQRAPAADHTGHFPRVGQRAEQKGCCLLGTYFQDKKKQICQHSSALLVTLTPPVLVKMSVMGKSSYNTCECPHFPSPRGILSLPAQPLGLCAEQNPGG